MVGTCEGRVFDERELKFEIGDGEGLGFPVGVEKAIMAMEQGEEAIFNMKPKYDQMYCLCVRMFIFYQIINVFIDISRAELFSLLGFFRLLYN